MNLKTIMQIVKDREVEIVSLRFTDINGRLHGISYTTKILTSELFKLGMFFDGSSVSGWSSVDNSDLRIIPDITTAFVDPCLETKTLVFICNIHYVSSDKRYEKDPRYVAERAMQYLSNSKIGDKAYFGAEIEFFLFENVRYGVRPNSSILEVDAPEGAWNEDKESATGNSIGYKKGYFEVSPLDMTEEVRNDMARALASVGIELECHHHEVASAQLEVDFKFGEIVKHADQFTMCKYIIKNVAKSYGLSACFMPKPIIGDNGSGMHIHQSLWRGDEALFVGEEYGNLSKLALNYIGGILEHSRSIAAIANPSTNSYKRLVPGYEAPTNLAYSSNNRSAAIRIPAVNSKKSKRIEARYPDTMANPYLVFAAMLMAGIDGIKNGINPGKPVDKNLYDMSEKELAKIPSLPHSLEEALNELDKSNAFLLEGKVFTKDLIDSFIGIKKQEVMAVNTTPNPREFELYYTL